MNFLHVLDISDVKAIGRHRTEIVKAGLKFRVEMFREIHSARLADGLQPVANQHVIMGFSAARVFDILRDGLRFSDLSERHFVLSALRNLRIEGLVRIGDGICGLYYDSRENNRDGDADG